MTEEDKNTELIEKLKNLPKIKTSDDFIIKLENRIAEFESEKIKKPVFEKKENFFQKIFGQKRNEWLVPALGLLILAVFTYSLVKFNESQIDEKLNSSETKTDIPIDKNSIKNNTGSTTLSDGNASPNDKSDSESESEKLREKISATERETQIKKNYPVPVESTSEKVTENKVTENNVTSSPPEIKTSVKTDLSKKENPADMNNPESKDGNESALGEETSAMKSGTITSETSVQQELKRSEDDETKEFEGEIDQSIIEKLNKVNKQKLDSLKKKINKP